MPDLVVTPSTAGLRALSHPTRLKILGRLRIEGPATATQLAQELKPNTGATSYHLRQLAEHGFIEDDTERGDGRDRWWKASHEGTRAKLDERGGSKEEADDAEAYLHTVALMYTETLMQYAGEHRYLPLAWRKSSTISDWHIRLTPARADELLTKLVSVIEEFEGDPEGTPNAASFGVNLNAFPRPGTVALEGGREGAGQ